MDSAGSLTRRSFLAGAGAAAAGAVLLAGRAIGSPQRADEGIVGLMKRQAGEAKIATQPLRRGISVLMGAGGNIGVLVGADGKLLVDAGISTAQPRVQAALDGLGAAPIRRLINTHWHFDHTDGNAWLHAEGAEIVAHENCRKRMSTSTRVEPWGYTFEPAPAEALPVVEFKSGMSLRMNAATIGLEAFSPAHTDSDIRVEFQEADVVHVGDIWWNGHYPFIDYATGGSIDGTIRAVEATLGRVTSKTVIIPGHGPVGGKDELIEFRDMLATVRERVGTMKRQGKSLAEILAAKPTKEFDGKYGRFLMAPDDFTKLVHNGA